MNMNPPETKRPVAVQWLTPGELKQLMANAPDQEMLLTIELAFRHCVWPTELDSILAEDVVFNSDGHPIAFGIVAPQRSKTSRWVMINPESSALLRALLPKSGPLFSDADPYGRLQRFAARIGLRLSRRCPRNSFILHALAAGWCLAAIAAKAGFTLEGIHRHHCLPVSHDDAGIYWGLRADLQRIASLPRHRRRLASTLWTDSAEKASLIFCLLFSAPARPGELT